MNAASLSLAVLCLALFITGCGESGKRATDTQESTRADSSTQRILRAAPIGAEELRGSLASLVQHIEGMRANDSTGDAASGWGDIAGQLRGFLNATHFPLRLLSAQGDGRHILLGFGIARRGDLPGDRFWLQLAVVGTRIMFVNILTEPETADCIVLATESWNCLAALREGARTLQGDRFALDARRFPDSLALRTKLQRCFSDAGVDHLIALMQPVPERDGLTLLPLIEDIRPEWSTAQIRGTTRDANTFTLALNVRAERTRAPLRVDVTLAPTARGWLVSELSARNAPAEGI